ncbi:MAG: site-2 protease family protein [Bacteroidia bacterium]|nr:site-2 protease family protein [Bacteroidia bacterium]MDW8236403.1 site-2 protease family protein [Bacteroidia bacterium]
MSQFSLRIATVAGIPVYIHWSFWLLLGWIIVSSFFAQGFNLSYLGARLLLMGGLVLSVILHELGHALAAKGFGIPTKDITMYPFGGVASLSRIPEKPIQELIVALAGPAVNFLLIGIFNSLLHLLGEPELSTLSALLLYEKGTFPPLEVWLGALSGMNLVLALFNLLPAFPMDGGRVLRALLATQMPYVKATRIAAFVGQAFAVLFILGGIYLTPVLILVGFFVFLAATQEKRYTEERSHLHGSTVADALLREVPVLPVGGYLEDAIRALLNSQARSFLIVGYQGEPVGSLSREQIIEALSEGKGRSTPIYEVMDTQMLIVPPTLPLQAGYNLLHEHQKPFLVVMQQDQLLGIVDAENIAEFLLIRQAEKPH